MLLYNKFQNEITVSQKANVVDIYLKKIYTTERNSYLCIKVAK